MSFLTSPKRTLAGLLVFAMIAGVAVWWFYPRQTLEGRLTDYYKTYPPFWDVACDTAMDGSDARCYLQYVDVYRPRPEFAAAMVEVVFHAGTDGTPDPHVRFDIEPGLSFEDTEVNVETPDGDVPLNVSDCRSNSCVISGEAGRDILAVWRSGTALRLTIDEDRDVPAQLSWPLNEMTAILDDLAAQRAARALP